MAEQLISGVLEKQVFNTKEIFTENFTENFTQKFTDSERKKVNSRNKKITTNEMSSEISISRRAVKEIVIH